MTVTTDWFTTFVGELETAAEAALPEIEAKAKEVGGQILTLADKAIGSMAQIAVSSVLKNVGLDIPGEQKFGSAVTNYLETVETQLGFLPSQPDAHAAIQAAYTKVAAKAAAKAAGV
jgi:hypothetical protein